jgi:hypothetical protein
MPYGIEELKHHLVNGNIGRNKIKEERLGMGVSGKMQK